MITSPLRKSCDACANEIPACTPFALVLVDNGNTATEWTLCQTCAEAVGR